MFCRVVEAVAFAFNSRQQRGAILRHQILRLLDALDRGLHVEVAGQHRLDQLVHHRIAELRPPRVGS